MITSRRSELTPRLVRYLPGVALCAVVSGVAYGVQSVEERLTGNAYLEALVLAILIGTMTRTAWRPGPIWSAGIAFAAKTLLETAVMLLGASLSGAALAAAGLPLLLGIAGIVLVSLLVSYGISRLLGLSHTMSVLVASGNSICGNSAIAAVATAIGASGEDVASSIAFTAILGVIVVLTLPLSVPLLGLTQTEYGTLAGLTVYAVPQVLAATLPVGALSAQVGTLVKLVRVLMLGPVVFAASLSARAKRGGAKPLPFFRLVPWFVIGFAVLTAARSAGAIPDPLMPIIRQLTVILTVLSMAALGLGVDLAVLRQVGARATAAVLASICALALLSYGLIELLHI
jgi:uncharacterized integral membrane protein (TIGR00698 family)